MNHPVKNHPVPNWAEMDVSLCELGYAVDLIEAVQTAIQTGDMPNEVCASSLFGAWMLLQRVYKPENRILREGAAAARPGHFLRA